MMHRSREHVTKTLAAVTEMLGFAHRVYPPYGRDLDNWLVRCASVRVPVPYEDHALRSADIEEIRASASRESYEPHLSYKTNIKLDATDATFTELAVFLRIGYDGPVELGFQLMPLDDDDQQPDYEFFEDIEIHLQPSWRDDGRLRVDHVAIAMLHDDRRFEWLAKLVSAVLGSSLGYAVVDDLLDAEVRVSTTEAWRVDASEALEVWLGALHKSPAARLGRRAGTNAVRHQPTEEDIEAPRRFKRRCIVDETDDDDSGSEDPIETC